MTEENKIENMTMAELNTALQSELDQLDGKVQAEPTIEPEATPEPTTEEGLQNPDEPAKGEDGEAEGDGEGNPYKKRIDRLLRKRDTLEETLAEREARILALEQENNQLKGGNEEPEESSDISKTIHKVLDEREHKSKAEQAQIKAQENEFNALTEKIPNASKRKAEILELAVKYPTLTFEAIDTILAPADHVDPIEANRKNAKRMDISPRSRADLEKDKDMTKATPAEQEKFLREQIASGKLVI